MPGGEGASCVRAQGDVMCRRCMASLPFVFAAIGRKRAGNAETGVVDQRSRISAAREAGFRRAGDRRHSVEGRTTEKRPRRSVRGLISSRRSRRRADEQQVVPRARCGRARRRRANTGLGGAGDCGERAGVCIFTLHC